MEEWKDYIYHYEISSFGRIRNKFTGKILKQQRDHYGYLGCVVSLGKQKNIKKIKTHRAVAECFIPNPNNLPQVNHIDGNKQNNYVDNLEWCNNAYNKQHAYDIGITRPLCGEMNYNSKLTNDDVLYIRKNYKPRNKQHGCRALARKYNVHHSSIELILHNINWKNNGFEEEK